MSRVYLEFRCGGFLLFQVYWGLLIDTIKQSALIKKKKKKTPALT